MFGGQRVAVRVGAQTFQGGVQATEVDALRVIGEAEVLLECLAPCGGLALLADPVLQLAFAGELQQRGAVAGHVQHGQVAGGVVQVEDVGGSIAIDVQRALAQLCATRHQACGLPDEFSGRFTEAAFVDLFVAGRDEIEFAGQPVVLQVLVPVAVQLGFEWHVEVQCLDETLEGFGVDRQVARGVISLRCGTAEQPIEYLESGAVSVETWRWQGLDQAQRAVGQGPGPRRAEQGAEQVVVGLSLPVTQQCVGQADALADRCQVAGRAIGVVVQGHDVDLVGVEIKALLRKPLADRPVGFAVRAGYMAQVVADVAHAGGVDVAWGHAVYLAHRRKWQG
ncbi:hypothetical protein D3C72_1249150 [compost metagenome]